MNPIIPTILSWEAASTVAFVRPWTSTFSLLSAPSPLNRITKLPELSQKARAPLRLSMEGVGELMVPDFCLTISTWVTTLT